MTREELKTTDFKRTKECVYHGEIYDIVSVDYTEDLLGLIVDDGNDDSDLIWVRCENVKLIEPNYVIDVHKLDLSTRTLNSLCAIGVTHLEQLNNVRKTDLLRFRNFGLKTLHELDEALKAKGLNWKE